MQPFETAFVSYGANDRPFAVVKEASIMKIDAKAFLEGLGALNKVGDVLKKGQLSEEAQKEVAGQIGGALDILAKAGALEALDNKPVDKTKLQKALEVVYGKVDSLALSLQAVDLNLADYASALKEDMQAAVEEAQDVPPPPPPAETPPAETAPPAPAPAATAPPATETPPAETQPETPPQEPPAGDPPKPEEVTTETGAAAPEEADTDPGTPQEPDADDGSEDDDVVTKADLESFGKGLLEQFMGTVQETVQTTVQKTVSALPASQPADNLENRPQQQEAAFNPDIGMESLDFGSTRDLSKLKLPGDA
jgi:hypothetical protein